MKKDFSSNSFINHNNISNNNGMGIRKERIIFLIGVVSIFFSSIISVFAANYLYSSSEVSFDNSSSGISSDNVQGAIDELYQNASDYSSLDSRIGVLEGRWKNSPESYFEKSGGEEWLMIKNSTSDNRGIAIKDGSNVMRGSFYSNPTDDETRVVAYNSSGKWGKGKLNLVGNPVMVNGKEVMTIRNSLTFGSWHNLFPFRTDNATIYVYLNGIYFDPSKTYTASVTMQNMYFTNNTTMNNKTLTYSSIYHADWGTELRFTNNISANGGGLIILNGSITSR